MSTMRRIRRGGVVVVGTAAAALAVTWGTTAASTARSGHAAGQGTVSVLYAGSLVKYMEDDLGPAFTKATGFGYEGFGAGSTEVASEIRGKVRQGDVFISAAATADQSLEGAANGSWVSWYSTFWSSPLELGYNPNSAFAAQLRKGVPWYKVITEKGILVGRTDPKLDPKGVLTVQAVDEAATKLHDPALTTALSSFPVYPEEDLVGRLQSGQLDAGFFYAVEAAAAKIPTVPLTPVSEVADYTITILNGAPNPAGAARFVAYILDAARGYTLKRNGLDPFARPKFTGQASAVPASIRRLVGAG